jgi:hypothetical protein
MQESSLKFFTRRSGIPNAPSGRYSEPLWHSERVGPIRAEPSLLEIDISHRFSVAIRVKYQRSGTYAHIDHL